MHSTGTLRFFCKASRTWQPRQSTAPKKRGERGGERMSVSVYPRSNPTALVAEASNRLLLDLSYARVRRTRAGGARRRSRRGGVSGGRDATSCYQSRPRHPAVRIVSSTWSSRPDQAESARRARTPIANLGRPRRRRQAPQHVFDAAPRPPSNSLATGNTRSCRRYCLQSRLRYTGLLCLCIQQYDAWRSLRSFRYRRR